MMILELPERHKFFCFADSQKLQELGFAPRDLKIEGCSHFVYLTQDKKTKKVQINIMFVDPYYDNI